MGQSNLAVVQNYEVDLVSEKRLQMVRDKFANGAPQDEFSLFIEFCKAKNLDPLQRQVYLIPRWDSKKNANVWSIQTSIDGYRAIADRTGAYAGSDDAVFTESGQKVWEKPRPDTAKVTVWKMVQGQRCPFTATARWDEYYQEKSPLWGKMPHTMLAKCAESLALRKAFPEQLSGVYTDTEMEQAGMPVETPPRPAQTATVTHQPTQPTQPTATVTEVVDTETGEIIEVQSRPVSNEPKATERQIKFLHAIAKDKGLTHDDLHEMAVKAYGVGVGELTKRDASAFVDKLHAMQPRTQQPTPIRQDVPVEQQTVDQTSWTEFWKWAREQGINGAPQFTELTQKSVQGLTPEQARQVLTTALSSMPA